MKRPLFFPELFLFFFLSLIAPALYAADFADGRIRLSLHEDTGRFSLYYMDDLSRESFAPLFTDQDPRTSFFSLILNDRSYRLGESSAFRLRRGENGLVPSFIFESAFLRVVEDFSFLKTAGSSLSNGIQITVTLENLSPQEVDLGLRFLVDTSLGEGQHGVPPFLTDKRPIDSETQITAKDDDRWWISRNDKLSLMGSISAGVGEGPDQVVFANWKRLNEVSWKINFVSGRNFNYLPYSIGDSAVCYYYEPQPLSRGDTRSYTILLSVEDEKGFTAYSTGAGDDLSRFLRETVPLPSEIPGTDSKQADIFLLRELINRIDRYVAGEIIITEEDLAAMEIVIARLKARYGLP
jgi:hypothetical protein